MKLKRWHLLLPILGLWLVQLGIVATIVVVIVHFVRKFW
jgi:hypothetical protein